MRVLNVFFSTAFFSMVLLSQAASATGITTIPASLTGNSGVFGWGFTLDNDTDSWMSVDSVQLFSAVDGPLYRFGPASNFSELFATYQFHAPAILIGPHSTFSQGYNGSGEGLATWSFPDGAGIHGNLSSNVFKIQVGYSLYDDNAYNTPTLDGGGSPLTGTMLADAQLQYPGSGCDINADGATNVADVQLIINEALGVSPAVHDLNHDGSVNVAEVQKVINAALALGCAA